MIKRGAVWLLVAALGWWSWAGFDHWARRDYCIRAAGPWLALDCGPPLPVWFWLLLAGLLASLLKLAGRKGRP